MLDICPWTLSVPKREQFSEGVARGKLSKDKYLSINGGYYVCYPSNIFRNTCAFKNWGI